MLDPANFQKPIAKWNRMDRINLVATALAGLSLLLPSVALSQAPRSYWSVRNEVAHTTMEYPAAKDPNATATLTVEFASIGNVCRPMVGIALLSGSAYGTRGSNGLASGQMTISVPGFGSWSARPMVVKYSNGVEAGIPVSDATIKALRSGKVVRINMLPDAPTFEFSLFGASSAFDRARGDSKACRY
jgi:hypothetical protein